MVHGYGYGLFWVLNAVLFGVCEVMKWHCIICFPRCVCWVCDFLCPYEDARCGSVLKKPCS